MITEKNSQEHVFMGHTYYTYDLVTGGRGWKMYHNGIWYSGQMMQNTIKNLETFVIKDIIEQLCTTNFKEDVRLASITYYKDNVSIVLTVQKDEGKYKIQWYAYVMKELYSDFVTVSDKDPLVVRDAVNVLLIQAQETIDKILDK